VLDSLLSSGNVSENFVLNVTAIVDGSIPKVTESTVSWTFSNSLFFAFTVATAIGYGNFVPVSVWGKFFTALYAFGGIYFYVYTIFKITERSIASVKWIVSRPTCSKSGNGDRYAVPRHTLLEWCCLVALCKSSDFVVVVFASRRLSFFTLLTFASLSLIVFLAVLALLLYQYEFLSSFYFAVITVSTTGLGDYTPVFNNADPLS